MALALPTQHRLAYDLDGTTGFRIQPSGVVTALVNANLVTMNNENPDSFTPPDNGSGQYKIGLLFPYPLTLVGLFANWYSGVQSSSVARIDWSADTTTGVDGTWTTLYNLASNRSQGPSVPEYRTIGPTAYAASGVKSIRVWGGTRDFSAELPHYYDLHVYGTYAPTTSKLEHWHPTLDQALSLTPAHLDFGDIAQGGAAVAKSYRVKNLSGSQTANSVVLGTSVVSDGLAPTIASQTQHRYDGGAYGATATIPSLAPGAISSTCDARLTIGATTQVYPRALRFTAVAGSWT
jgi:hypothetical protein